MLAGELVHQRPMRLDALVMRPAPEARAWTSGRAASILSRVSTAIDTAGRFSEALSSRSVCKRWWTPKPSAPRRSTLVWIRCRP
jgi:hypothetical protein